MAEVYDFKEGWKRRLCKNSEKVESLTAGINLDAKDGIEKAKVVAELQKNTATDFKYYSDMVNAEAQSSIDLAKIGTEAAKTEVEKEKNKWMSKVDILKIVVSVLGIVFGPLVTLVFERYKERKRDERFKIANKFEDEDAYIKSSQRKAVDEGLRDTSDKPGRWGTFFKQ